MAQPEWVPVAPADDVRPAERMPPAVGWTVDRPGEIAGLRVPAGGRFGVPGPDQGYALTLARRLHDRLELAPGEHRDDVVAGCLAVALKRASLFGRAPVTHDLELAATLFGFLGGAPAALVEFRRPLFAGAAHDYWAGRRTADAVPEPTLRLTPAAVGERLASWESLLAG
ncbi:MAG: hypothetical protein ACRD0D_15785 [Acidimicrobiales bacterium]